MSAPAGWYPDPDGRPGHFRFWDGRAWSSELSSDPAAEPPGQRVPAAPAGAVRGGWLGLAALAVVLLVVAFAVVRTPGGTVPPPDGSTPPSSPSAAPTPDGCPEARPGSPPPGVSPTLAYPRLPAPWTDPPVGRPVSLGRHVTSQVVLIEDDGYAWAASVQVAELPDDPAATLRDTAAAVAWCITGLYSLAFQRSETVVNRARPVDGHDGWVVEVRLSFQAPGVTPRGQRLIIVVVDTGPGSTGLFYASVPDGDPRYVKPARAALASLRVEG